MDPLDFLNTASSLVKSSAESDLRTSVSRSYYAVILFYRDYLAKKLGFLPENLRKIHQFIPECFGASGLKEAEKIELKINRAKAARHHADYKLSKKLSKTKAGDCLDLARELIAHPISIQVIAEAKKRVRTLRLIK